MSMLVMAPNWAGGEHNSMLRIQVMLQVSQVHLGIVEGLHQGTVLVHHEVLGPAIVSSKSDDSTHHSTVVRCLYDLAAD